MPDIEEIIETLAPFAFVLIWIFSAVVGRAKEQPPSKTSRPIFGPVPDNSRRVSGPDQATVMTEPGKSVDWRDLESDNPYSRTSDTTAMRAEEEARIRKERMARALRERQMKEAARAKREAAMRRTSDDAGKSQTPPVNKPVNLSHLVSDHAAEMHLEHALTDRSPSSTEMRPKRSLRMRSIIAGMKDKESVRQAVIMSIVLGEPRSKLKSDKRL